MEFFSSVQGADQLEIVPDEYFQRRHTAHSANSTPVKVKMAKKRQQASKKRSRYESDEDSMVDEDEEGSFHDEDEEGPQRYGSRASSRGPTSSQGSLQRRNSTSLPPLAPPYHQAQSALMGPGGGHVVMTGHMHHLPPPHPGLPFLMPDFQSLFHHGDASATIKITGRPPKAMGPTTGAMMFPHQGMMYAHQQQRPLYTTASAFMSAPSEPPPPTTAPAPAPTVGPSCGNDWQKDCDQMWSTNGGEEMDGEQLLSAKYSRF